jgi:predicted nucleic acid-binding protein
MLFDTRYFWAIFTAKSQDTTEKLRAIFDKSKATYVSSITLYEVYKMSVLSEDKEVARLRVRTIQKEFDVVDVDAQIAEEGAELAVRLRIPMADSLIMATAKRLGVSCVTDDAHYSEVRKVWI